MRVPLLLLCLLSGGFSQTYCAGDQISLTHQNAPLVVGAGYDESIHDKISYSLGKRHPWLQVNLLTAFMAAGIIFLFQNEIKQLTLLAVFMPVHRLWP